MAFRAAEAADVGAERRGLVWDGIGAETDEHSGRVFFVVRPGNPVIRGNGP